MEYFEQLYHNKFDDMDEMDSYLEKHKLSTLTQGEIDNNPESTKGLNF